jgi:RNA recognition motif-containing protein
MVDPETGRSRGFGFVQYKHFSEATRAIAEMNGYQLENKYLKVAFKTPNEKSLAGGKPGKQRRSRNGRKNSWTNKPDKDESARLPGAILQKPQASQQSPDSKVSLDTPIESLKLLSLDQP